MAPHPPKRETFDVDRGVNVDPKGFVRHVEVYREWADGLFMARPIVDHPTLAGVRSWLLPGLGLRVSHFAWFPGHELDQDWYVDVADVVRDDRCWRTEDHYLDLVVRTGRGTELVDVDEYLEAVGAGLLDPATAERALRRALDATAGLAVHDHDLPAWLGSRGVRLVPAR